MVYEELKPFEWVLIQCEGKLARKRPQYGESWRTMSITELAQRLKDKIRKWEYLFEDDPRNLFQKHELVDIINIALMLATRLKVEDEEVIPFRES